MLSPYARFHVAGAASRRPFFVERRAIQVAALVAIGQATWQLE
jgi:hypothetical protein